MKLQKHKPAKPEPPRNDQENPEWTKEDFARGTRFKRGTTLEQAAKVMAGKRDEPTPTSKPQRKTQ